MLSEEKLTTVTAELSHLTYDQLCCPHQYSSEYNYYICQWRGQTEEQCTSVKAVSCTAY